MQSSPSKHDLSCKCQTRKNLNVNNKCGKRQKFHRYIRERITGRSSKNIGFISQIKKCFKKFRIFFMLISPISSLSI